MAVIAFTDNPEQLRTFLIDNIKSRRILSWVVDEDDDITIANYRWKEHAWFKIIIKDNSVVFGFVPSKFYKVTKDLYGIFHGRLAVTLLANFDELIDDLNLTPGFLTGVDIIPPAD